MLAPGVYPSPPHDRGDSYTEEYDQIYDDVDYSNEDELKSVHYGCISPKPTDADETKSNITPNVARSRSSSWTTVTHSSGSRTLGLELKEPSFFDAFRAMYLSRNISETEHASEFLATKKKQDHIKEILKKDGLGSKKWYFYPRRPIALSSRSGSVEPQVDYDKRVKVEEYFLKKYKKDKKLTEQDTPLAKLKRWELSLYEKLGFIQAV